MEEGWKIFLFYLWIVSMHFHAPNSINAFPSSCFLCSCAFNCGDLSVEGNENVRKPALCGWETNFGVKLKITVWGLGALPEVIHLVNQPVCPIIKAVISKQRCSRLLPETIKQVIIISAPLANGIHLSAQGKMLISFALKQYTQPFASEMWLPTPLLKISSDWRAKSRGEITWSLLHLTVVGSSQYRHGTNSYRFHQGKDENTVLVSRLNMVTSLFHLTPSSFSHFCKLNIWSEVIWVIFDFDNCTAGLS